MTRYWEIPVTLRFITKGDELTRDDISHRFQMCSMPGLAEFVQGELNEIATAGWVERHKQMEFMMEMFKTIEGGERT